jgi:hypothetical protein
MIGDQEQIAESPMIRTTKGLNAEEAPTGELGRTEENLPKEEVGFAVG